MLITQQCHVGNLSSPGILKVITDWPEDIMFGTASGEILHATEAHSPMNCQKTKRNMSCSLMGHVELRGSAADGKLQCGAPHSELRKPLKVREH